MEIHAEEVEVEVDCVVTNLGTGSAMKAEPGDEQSQLTDTQYLTANPPLPQGRQKDLPDGLSETHPLTSDAVKDGQTPGVEKYLAEAERIKQSAADGMDVLVRSMKELCQENSKLREENERLVRQNDGALRSREEGNWADERRAIIGKLAEAQQKITQLQNRCWELLAENDRLKSAGGSTSSSDVSKDAVPTSPLPTESMGNAQRNVDPVKVMAEEQRLREGTVTRVGQGGNGEEVGARVQAKPRKVPSTEELADFLADHIQHGDQTNRLLRSLDFSSVEIADIEVSYPKNPREQRLQGILQALQKLPNVDRAITLLQKLVAVNLVDQAEQVCTHFGLDFPAGEGHKGQKSHATPLKEAVSEPVVIPESDFERLILPFLRHTSCLRSTMTALSKENDWSDRDVNQFTRQLSHWKQKDNKQFHDQCVKSDPSREGYYSAGVVAVLNAWACVELDQSETGAQQVEGLFQALRTSQKANVTKILKTYLQFGVVGPVLARRVYLRNIPFPLKLSLVEHLNLRKTDGSGWQGLVEEIGYGQKIKFWEEKSNPADLLWKTWTTSNSATIGKLYDWAVKVNRMDIAEVMEKEEK